jgi:hypothetical protein
MYVCRGRNKAQTWPGAAFARADATWAAGYALSGRLDNTSDPTCFVSFSSAQKGDTDHAVQALPADEFDFLVAYPPSATPTPSASITVSATPSLSLTPSSSLTPLPPTAFRTVDGVWIDVPYFSGPNYFSDALAWYAAHNATLIGLNGQNANSRVAANDDDAGNNINTSTLLCPCLNTLKILQATTTIKPV